MFAETLWQKLQLSIFLCATFSHCHWIWSKYPKHTRVCECNGSSIIYDYNFLCLGLEYYSFQSILSLKNVFKIMIVIMIMYSWYGGRLKFSNHRGFCKNRNVKYLKGISEETSDFRCNDKKLFKMYKVFNTFNICILLRSGELIS